MASVGLTEKSGASEAGYEVKVGHFPFIGNGKAIALGEPEGMVKTVFDAKTGELLGAHMVGAEVTEMIQGYAIARRWRHRGRADHTVFPHPTLSEMMHESGARRLWAGHPLLAGLGLPSDPVPTDHFSELIRISELVRNWAYGGGRGGAGSGMVAQQGVESGKQSRPCARLNSRNGTMLLKCSTARSISSAAQSWKSDWEQSTRSSASVVILSMRTTGFRFGNLDSVCARTDPGNRRCRTACGYPGDHEVSQRVMIGAKPELGIRISTMPQIEGFVLDLSGAQVRRTNLSHTNLTR